MSHLLLVLAFIPRPVEREIYFRDSIWYQHAELRPGERVTLAGHSAGAHSAAMMAFDPANKGRIKKVKLMSGVYKVDLSVRLATAFATTPRRAFRGMSRWEASPLYNIPPADADSPVADRRALLLVAHLVSDPPSSPGGCSCVYAGCETAFQ